MKIALLSLVLLATTGCSLIAPSVGPRVAKAVNRYCEEPFQARMLMRSEVNAMIQPNRIMVVCEGDPANEPPAQE